MYEPEPIRFWQDPAVVETFRREVNAVDEGPVVHVPMVIERPMTSDEKIASVDPADPDRLIAEAASASTEEVDRAVASCAAVQDEWAAIPMPDRTRLVRSMADWMRTHRDHLAARQVFEAGKPWSEADADVCEAIDFCMYYAEMAERLAAGEPVLSPPGERNEMFYRPRGVTAVIGPWNFPFAIPTGMTVAALVAGNTVCLKPAEQTPWIAYGIVEAALGAGVPEEVLAFLPGEGEVAGARLVDHPDVATIAFTGSRQVGFSILEAVGTVRPGQVQIKRAITELGGKNAMFIDADADLDDAIPAVAASSFGFAGQKCSAASRLVVYEDQADQVVDRLIAHAETLVVGHPRAPETTVGPVVDEEAHARLLAAIRDTQGRVRYQHGDVPERGWFVPPTIVDRVPDDDPLVTQEQFGPILAVQPATDLDHVVELMNRSDFALTAGIFSRSPQVIARLPARIAAGNIYINRAITGAVVGRQPFGGFRHSGVGAKAGGPDYLKHFCDAVVVTENTLRQGFAADQLLATERGRVPIVSEREHE